METLQDFVKKALERLNMKSERPSKTMFVGDLGEEILLEALSMEELNEINRRYSGEPGKMDEYAVFRGRPTIRALSKRLSELEAISEPLDVMKIFKRVDVREMAAHVISLSGLLDKTTVREIEAVKN